MVTTDTSVKSQKKKKILIAVDGGHCNALKSTQYFLKTREKPDRRRIKIEWIEDTVENPIHTEVQSDGRIRKWKKIEEEHKFLRVVLLGDGETVHNAFFDRSFKGKI
jgi:hypothetical protein